jgi:hypothetical protein
VLALILLMTRATELGDTSAYASDIIDHFGKSPFGRGNTLWEFGHLLWRPFGWLLLTLTSPLLSMLTAWTPVMQADFVLIVVSTVCALASIVLWHAIALRASGSRGIALLVAVAMACSHGFLLYAHSGCAYVPGLTFLTASLYLLLARKTKSAACFYALAVLTWLPYIFAGAGLLIMAAWSFESGSLPMRMKFARADARSALQFFAISAVIVIAVYGAAAGARQISSVGEAKEWFAAAGHGFSPGMKIVRVATGLPRSLLYLGKDGILYKRYLRHDPFAPVTLRGIIGASLWKLAAFYLFVVCLLYELLRRPSSGWMLLVFSAGVAPIIFFAVVIFEPGSPERFLPAFPFLVLALAWILRDVVARRRVTQLFIGAFLVGVILTNGYSFAAPRVDAENSAELSRVADLRGRLNGAGMVMVATNQDDLEPTLNRLAFDKINRPTPLLIYDIVEPGNVRVQEWRQQFAARSLEIWRNGGDVWVSKRVWSARPAPSWNWAEGDDPHVSWKELPQFFATLRTDADSGGPDGFLRIAHNESNLALLTPLAASAPEGK